MTKATMSASRAVVSDTAAVSDMAVTVMAGTARETFTLAHPASTSIAVAKTFGAGTMVTLLGNPNLSRTITGH